jgi:hypothetical protein
MYLQMFLIVLLATRYLSCDLSYKLWEAPKSTEYFFVSAAAFIPPRSSSVQA